MHVHGLLARLTFLVDVVIFFNINLGMQGQIQRGDLNVQADFWSMESGAGPPKTM